MTEAKHTLDKSAMVRVGRQLQEARLGMGYSTGGIAPSLMAARTQIEDLEAGRMGTFYSAHYYLSLFQRYASFLKFSPEAVAAMVRELKGEPAPAPAPAMVAQDTPEPAMVAQDTPEPAIALEHSAALEPSAPLPTPAQHAPDPPISRPQPPSSSGLGDRLLALLALLAVGAVAWVLLSEQQPAQKASAPSATAASTGAPAPVPAPASASAPVPAPAPAPAVTSQDSSPPPANSPAVEAKPAPKPAPSPKPETAAGPDTDALVLRFPEKSWIWVRRADDTVSEVAVAQGSTLRFPEMPIYMVLPRPAEIQVTVRGRKATLSRNDAERDMGRFTRTMLEEAAAR